MNGYVSQSLSPKKILTVAVNLLQQCLIDSSRTEAKRVFHQLSAGKEIALARLAMEDASELIVNVSLDTTECCGTLSFSGFRKILATMLARIAQQIEASGDLNMFRDEDASQLLFNLPGFELQTSAGKASIVNVLVLGVKQSVAGEITLKLMYLEPGQFASLLPQSTDIAVES